MTKPQTVDNGDGTWSRETKRPKTKDRPMPPEHYMNQPSQTEQKIDFIIGLMKQAVVSAYEDGQAQNTKATLQLDEDFVRRQLQALLTASNREAVIKALTPYTDLQDETEATKFDPCNFCGQVSYRHTCDSALIGVEKMANRDIAELKRLGE